MNGIERILKFKKDLAAVGVKFSPEMELFCLRWLYAAGGYDKKLLKERAKEIGKNNLKIPLTLAWDERDC